MAAGISKRMLKRVERARCDCRVDAFRVAVPSAARRDVVERVYVGKVMRVVRVGW